MTVSTGTILKQIFDVQKALGDKSVSSDAMMVIDGYEETRLLIKQFPWPTLSPGGEIAVPQPNGSESWQPQQLKTNQQGQVTATETIKGHIAKFLEQVVAQGGKFNATIYEGTLERYHRGVRIVDCFLQTDNPDRDWENRGQLTQISGTMFFHYFGETLPGNIS